MKLKSCIALGIGAGNYALNKSQNSLDGAYRERILLLRLIQGSDEGGSCKTSLRNLSTVELQ